MLFLIQFTVSFLNLRSDKCRKTRCIKWLIPDMKNLIIEKCGEDAYNFFSGSVNAEAVETLVVSTTNVFNILNHNGKVNVIINLSRNNDIRFLNKFFETANLKLANGDFFISCFASINFRGRRGAY